MSSNELYKIVLVGDSGVGKTNLLAVYTSDKGVDDQGISYAFKENAKPTIGVEFATTMYTSKLDGKEIKAQLWDTAGQERYKAITSSHYRRAAGALVVYDVSNPASFENALSNWLSNLLSASESGTMQQCIMLCGNKVDLEQRVAANDHLTRAKEAGILLTARTSAVTGEGVTEAFERLIEKVHQVSTGLEAPDDMFDDPSMQSSPSPRPVSVRSAPSKALSQDGQPAPTAPAGCCVIS